MQGKTVALFVQSKAGAASEAVDSVTALPDAGIAGDFHGKSGGPRQVVLVSQHDLSLFDLEPGSLREQITVDLPQLMELAPGTRLSVGEAVLEISGDCAPCSHIGEQLGVADANAFEARLQGRRGKLARVVEVTGGGRIAVGDAVVPLE